MKATKPMKAMKSMKKTNKKSHRPNMPFRVGDRVEWQVKIDRNEFPCRGDVTECVWKGSVHVIPDIGSKKHPMEFKPASLSLVQKASERGAEICWIFFCVHDSYTVTLGEQRSRVKSSITSPKHNSSRSPCQVAMSRVSCLSVMSRHVSINIFNSFEVYFGPLKYLTADFRF